MNCKIIDCTKPSRKLGMCQTLEQMKIELDKCILVCSNCHKEIHGDITEAGTN